MLYNTSTVKTQNTVNAIETKKTKKKGKVRNYGNKENYYKRRGGDYSGTAY